MTIPFYALFTTMAAGIIRMRIVVLVLVALCTIFFASRMQYLEFDSSKEVWFVPGDPTLIRMERFWQTFGNDEFIFLAFDAKSALNPSGLRTLAGLVEELEREIPFCRRVTWLGNAEYIEAAPDGITVRDLVDPATVTDADILGIVARALAEKAFRDSYIAADGETLGVLVELNPYPQDGKDHAAGVAAALRKIVEKEPYAAMEPRVVGPPVLYAEYNELSFQESVRFMALCLAVQLGLLLLLARSVLGAFSSLAVIVCSLVWTVGIIEVYGYKLNLFIVMVPVLLICVGIGDSVHIVALYRQMRDAGMPAKTAMVRAVGESGYACFLTTITTMIGFLVFNIVEIQPFREMGVYAATGTAMALLLSWLLVPVLHGWRESGAVRPCPEEQRESGGFERFLLWVHAVNRCYPKQVLAVFFVLGIVAAVGYARVEVESNTARMLGQNYPLRQAYDFVDTRMGGAMSLEIVLDTGKDGGVKEPEFLRRLARLQEEMETLPLVTKTASVLDILRRINQAMHGDDPAFHTVPATRQAVAQYLLLYEMADGKQMDSLVSFGEGRARLSAKTKTLDTREVRHISDRAAELAQSVFGDGVSIEVTGSVNWTRSMNDLLGEGQRKSFLAALGAIGLILIFALRSVRLGIIGLLPNIVPVLFTLGFMGFAGIYMDMPLMCFSAVIISVAADDTIHFMIRFKAAFRENSGYEDAIRDTLLHVGRPLTSTTLMLVAGFCVFLFSDIVGVAKFGGLAGFAFLWAYLADFFLVPSLLLLCKPLGLNDTQ